MTPRLLLARLDKAGDTFDEEVDVWVEVNWKRFMVLLRDLVSAFVENVLVVKQSAVMTSLQLGEFSFCL